MTTDTIQQAAEVLGQHAWSAAIGGCYGTGICHWSGDDREDEQVRHAHHVAQILADAGLLPTAPTVKPSRDDVIAALDDRGAFCGTCDRQPGDRLDDCADCTSCLNGYADVVLALLPGRTEAEVRASERARIRARYAEALERDDQLGYDGAFGQAASGHGDTGDDRIKAEAWDEGYHHGRRRIAAHPSENPYRDEVERGEGRG